MVTLLVFLFLHDSLSELYLCVMELIDGKFHLLERAPGVSVEEIKEKTAAELVINGDVPEINLN